MSTRSSIENLYRRPFQSKRTGPLYNAFSYPTKIDPEAVAVFLATHTQPGGFILDPFAGSGSSGIAACLCDRPTDRMRSLAQDYGVKPKWGPRNAVLYEISPLGALLAQVMSNPPDPSEFSANAEKLIDEAEDRFGWVYKAAGPDGEQGHIRYIIWSEVLRTPCCGNRLTLWDAVVGLDPAEIRETFDCPVCKKEVAASACERVLSSSVDQAMEETIEQREWRPARIYGRSNGKTWSRMPTSDDLALIERIRSEPIDSNIPTSLINWGDLHRSGYHTGITRFHHLYTQRNLNVLGSLWRGIEQQSPEFADVLKLLVLSYNASHSTLMTRVVAKKNQKELVVTGAQSGVMYVSGLPVEKNIFEGVRRKIQTFSKAFELIRGSKSEVRVVNGSSTKIDLTDDAVDYVFTDPPFGDFIPYAEVNQVNEAWLGKMTDRTEEAIISPSQNKSVDEYAELMSKVFSEVARVLRPSGAATVVFHASKPPVWQALGEAFRQNGFVVEKTSVLDKTQVSFKQVVHEGGTRGDAIFLLGFANEGNTARVSKDEDSLDRIVRFLEIAAKQDPTELEPRRMYSRYVALCVERDVPVALTAPEFYERLAQRRFDLSMENP